MFDDDYSFAPVRSLKHVGEAKVSATGWNGYGRKNPNEGSSAKKKSGRKQKRI